MEEAKFIFSSDSLELKSEGEDFYVEGYISTSDLDLVDDIVTKSCLLDMADQMRERVIKFDVEHEAFRGKGNFEKEMNKTIIPVAKVEEFLVDKKGLKVRAKLNRYAKRFDEVKGSIEEKFLDAFSIAYIPVKAVIEEREGKNIRLLDKIKLLNVAFTGNPVNTEARMTNVFAKSLDVLEDHNHVGDTLIKSKEVKNMPEEKDEAVESTEESNESTDAPAEETAAEETTEAKDESAEEESTSEETVESENAEVKALKEKVEVLSNEVERLKSMTKKPIHKSVVTQEDKSDNFEEKATKSLNPLDRI